MLGVAAIRNQRARQEALLRAGEHMEAETIGHIESQVTKFKEELARFASEHKTAINSDPAFRQRFHEMTRSVGVDPLLTNKGFWGKLLGVGDFYYELGIQILDVCISTRPVNGGVLELQDLLRRVRAARRGRGSAINEKDVEQAIDKLRLFGNGLRLVRASGRTLVVSVPQELSEDSTLLVSALVDAGGHSSAAGLASHLRWPADRVERGVRSIVAEGLVWVDDTSSERLYWLPAESR